MTRSITTPKLDIGMGKLVDCDSSFEKTCSDQVSPWRGVVNTNIATDTET